MNTFNEKVAVVTGGNSGIGYATAQAFIEKGAKVIITGRRKDAVEKAAEELGAIPIVADQSDLDDIDQLCKELGDQFKKIDILFINAGVTGTMGLIEHAGTENFDTVMNINFRGAYFTLSKFIPLLKDGASVVILSSIVAHTHLEGSSVYQASKAALNSIAKTAAKELAPRKIRVNLVSPGPHKTEALNKAGLDAPTLQRIHERLVDEIPLKKMGEASDVAQLVTYLCEESANFITGAEVIVDGGMTL